MTRLRISPMSILPLLPILFLLGGALAVALSRVVRLFRYDEIASAASILAMAAMMPLASDPSAHETMVSAWRPLSVFGAPVSLRLDRLDWLMGFAAVVVCTSVAMTGMVYPGRRRFGPRALALGMTGAFVAAAFSANMLTLTLSWGMFDALFAIAALLRSERAQAGRRAASAIVFNVAATICLWVAALIVIENHQSQYWHLTNLPDTARDFMLLAAILRMGLYPLSQWLPAERDDAPGRITLLYVLPPLAGLHILIRLAGLNSLPRDPALTGLAALSLLVGGALAWWRAESRDAIPYVALSILGAVVLGGTSRQPTVDATSALAAGAISWVFAIMALSVSRGFDRRVPWWSIGHALAIAAIIGVPATLAFAVRTSLAAGVASDPDLLLLIATLVGETFTFGALIRLASAPEQNEAPSGRVAIGIYAAAIALVALPPFLLPALARTVAPAVTPPAFEVVWANLGPLGIAIFLLPIVLSIVLEWYRRTRALSPAPDPTRLLDLDWLYDLVFRILSIVARFLREVARVIEGEGALLWALLGLIAAYVILSGTVP